MSLTELTTWKWRHIFLLYFNLACAYSFLSVHPRELTIRLGEFDFSQHENSRRRDYRVSRIVRHPQFNESNNNFADIALIKVNEDVSKDFQFSQLKHGFTNFTLLIDALTVIHNMPKDICTLN